MDERQKPAEHGANRAGKGITRTAVSRVLNALLWLVFCAMSGTGLLLAFRMPGGGGGGRLTALGLTRHEWGDWHTWLSYAFLALIAIHLALHWRWFWQVAARRRSWPLVAGIGAGLLLMAALVLQPVATAADRSGKAGGKGRGQQRVEQRADADCDGVCEKCRHPCNE